VVKVVGKHIFDSSVEELHSFDAYYKKVVFKNNTLVIPYINLGVSNHVINPSSDILFIDFAYMIFKAVSYLTVYIKGKRLIVIDTSKKEKIYYFGGSYLDIDVGIFNDMEICCKKSYLQTLDISRISDVMWIPQNVPNYSINIDIKIVEDFYSGKLMPNEVKKIIENDGYCLPDKSSDFYDSSE